MSREGRERGGDECLEKEGREEQRNLEYDGREEKSLQKDGREEERNVKRMK